MNKKRVFKVMLIVFPIINALFAINISHKYSILYLIFYVIYMFIMIYIGLSGDKINTISKLEITAGILALIGFIVFYFLRATFILWVVLGMASLILLIRFTSYKNRVGK